MGGCWGASCNTVGQRLGQPGLSWNGTAKAFMESLTSVFCLSWRAGWQRRHHERFSREHGRQGLGSSASISPCSPVPWVLQPLRGSVPFAGGHSNR